MSTRIVDFTVDSSDSRIGFECAPEDSCWDRYLTIDGVRAIQVGVDCETCGFFFSRLPGADTVDIAKWEIPASSGGAMDLELTAREWSRILPRGRYYAMLVDLSPKRVTPGGEMDYFTNEYPATWKGEEPPRWPATVYYRGRTSKLDEGATLFEFVVPLQDPSRLDSRRVQFYERGEGESTQPAIALSVLDIHRPYEWWLEPPGDPFRPVAGTHWCWTHYLLDGNHRVAAAASSNSSISVVALVTMEQGIASAENHQKLREFLL